MSQQEYEADTQGAGRLTQVNDLAELRSPSAEPLTPGQLAQLQNSATQAEYQQQFRLQQARRDCPGCGDC